MEKIKRITAEQLCTANSKPTHRTIIWHGIAVTVRTLLPIQEVSMIINSVMDACYDQTHDVFMPEMKDFAFRANVVSHYACVDFPNDIEEQYSILYNTDIFDTVVAAVNPAQIESIRETLSTLMANTR